MDPTPFLQPAFILPALVIFVGLVAWLIRLETKANIAQKDASDTKLLLAAHREDGDIHFNIRVSEQVDRRNEHRFQTIEHQLTEINRKLDHIADRK